MSELPNATPSRHLAVVSHPAELLVLIELPAGQGS